MKKLLLFGLCCLPYKLCADGLTQGQTGGSAQVYVYVFTASSPVSGADQGVWLTGLVISTINCAGTNTCSDDGNGILTITGTGSPGGGGGGGGVFISSLTQQFATSVSTLLFPRDDFLLDFGASIASVTIRNSTRTWTAAQTFNSSATFNYIVTVTSMVKLNRSSLIVGSSDYFNQESTGVFLVGLPFLANLNKNHSPIIEWIARGDYDVSGTNSDTISSMTLQLFMGGTTNAGTVRNTPGLLQLKNNFGQSIFWAGDRGLYVRPIGTGAENPAIFTNLFQVGGNTSIPLVSSFSVSADGIIEGGTFNVRDNLYVFGVAKASDVYIGAVQMTIYMSTITNRLDALQIDTTSLRVDVSNLGVWVSSAVSKDDWNTAKSTTVNLASWNTAKSTTVNITSWNTAKSTTVNLDAWSADNSTGNIVDKALQVDTTTLKLRLDAVAVDTTALVSGSGYSVVAEEGTPLTSRATLNFIGTAITCVDNDPTTDCTVTGSGGGISAADFTGHTTTADIKDKAIAVDTTTLKNVSDAITIATTTLALSTTIISNQEASDISNKTYYVRDETTGTVSVYQLLGSSPSAAAEISKTRSITSGGGMVRISSHITASGDPGITKISAGVWSFTTWAQVASLANISQLVITISTIGVDGTNIGEIVSSTASSFVDTNVERFDMVGLQTADVVLSTSDRILVQYFGRSASIIGINMTLYYQGASRFTHLSAPFGSVFKLVQLADTPATLLGNGGKYLAVNDDQTTTVFVSSPVNKDEWNTAKSTTVNLAAWNLAKATDVAQSDWNTAKSTTVNLAAWNVAKATALAYADFNNHSSTADTVLAAAISSITSLASRVDSATGSLRVDISNLGVWVSTAASKSDWNTAKSTTVQISAWETAKSTTVNLTAWNTAKSTAFAQADYVTHITTADVRLQNVQTATGTLQINIYNSTSAAINSNAGSFTNTNLTVNAQGQITAAANGTAGGGGGGGSGAAYFDGTTATAFTTVTMLTPFGASNDFTSANMISSVTVFDSTAPYRTISIPAPAWQGVDPTSASWETGGYTLSVDSRPYNVLPELFHKFSNPTSTRAWAYTTFRMPFEWDGSTCSFSVSWFASTGNSQNVNWSMSAIATSSGTNIFQAWTTSTTVPSTWVSSGTEINSDPSPGFSFEGSPRPGSRVRLWLSAFSGGFNGFPLMTEVTLWYRQAVWDGRPR